MALAVCADGAIRGGGTVSSGHPHARPNVRHPSELSRLRGEGDFVELMKRWQKLDVDHDVPDLSGYSVDGTTCYIDKDAFHAILDPDYAQTLVNMRIDTGISEEQTITCLVEHEHIEKVLLDADNPIHSYADAHDLATIAEHDLVRKFGGKPHQYDRGLDALFEHCEGKGGANPPKDLACASLLEDHDVADERALKALDAAGVTDAAKQSRTSVSYGKSTGQDQCRGCANWQGDRAGDLSPCAVVCGLVRAIAWCKQYKAAK